LSKVSFTVGQTEVVALIGENGAGKSTLMKTLGGVHQSEEGDIFFDGTKVAITKVADAIALGIGFVHQELNVLDNLDVATNILAPGIWSSRAVVSSIVCSAAWLIGLSAPFVVDATAVDGFAPAPTKTTPNPKLGSSRYLLYSGDFRRFAHIASPSTLRLLPMQRCRAQVGLPKEH
jgi:ABC transporter